MRKVIIWIVVLGVVFLVGSRVYQSRQRIRSSRNQEVAPTTPVQAIEPRVGDISSTLEFVGNIKGEDQAQVFAEAPGNLLKYTVTEGQMVAKDEVISMIDRAVTGMEFEPLKVKSPISGIVGKLFLDQGSAVAPQVPVAMIARMGKVKAIFNIPEKDLASVKIGLPAKITVDAYPDEVFMGKVIKISPVMDPMTPTCRGEALIPNPSHKLKPGMFAEIELIVETRESAILIPRDAVIHDPKTNKFYLFVVESGNAVRKEVEIGITGADTVEIKSGISEQDRVIIKGQHYLKGGEQVEIVQ